MRASNRTGDGQGIVNVLILSKMIEIDYECICTWVYHHPSGLHRLKYKNSGCIAVVFHAQIEGSWS